MVEYSTRTVTGASGNCDSSRSAIRTDCAPSCLLIKIALNMYDSGQGSGNAMVVLEPRPYRRIHATSAAGGWARGADAIRAGSTRGPDVRAVSGWDAGEAEESRPRH